MNGLLRAIIWLYIWLLHLYPPDFRAVFAEEMTAVFVQVVSEAAKQGWWIFSVVFLRELRDLPPNLARAHWYSLTKGGLSGMTIRKKPEWFFYPAWICLQAIAVPIAFILSFAVVLIAVKGVGGYIYVGGVRYITEDYLFDYIFISTNVLMTGILQFLLLRRYLPHMGAWILVTLAGGLLGTALIFGWLRVAPHLGTGGLPAPSWAIDSVFIFLGFSVGVGQWLLLRRRLPQAGWWIVANVFGWGMLRLATSNSLTQINVLLITLLPACATAAALGYLMNQALSLASQDS